MCTEANSAMRRMGDRIQIEGAYQYSALHRGNAVQRFWHESKLDTISRLLQPERGDFVIDVGCGSGVCAAFAADRGAEVLGVDGNAAAISFATKQFAGSRRARFRLALLDELSELPPSSFNKAMCLEVLEHLAVSQIRVLLASIYECLRESGLLLITTPNYRSAWPLIEFSLDQLHLVPKLREEQHVTKLHHRGLRCLAESHGFELVTRRAICTLAPWLAPLSQRLGRGVRRLELSVPVPFGTILAHLYRKSHLAL